MNFCSVQRDHEKTWHRKESKSNENIFVILLQALHLTAKKIVSIEKCNELLPLSLISSVKQLQT